MLKRAGPWATLAGLLALYGALGQLRLGGFRIELGSVGFPRMGYLAWEVMCLVLLVPASLALAVALRPWVAARWPTWQSRLAAVPPARASLLVVLAGVLLPLLAQALVLHGAPLTDDEAAYRFAAQTLATFHLSVPSPPMKLFYDNAFLINDGRIFTHFFLGWPLVLAPATWVGLVDLVNPLLSGLTALGLWLWGRRWWGPSWALAAVAVLLLSPMVTLGAATLMSHTVTTCLLAWLFVTLDRLEDEPQGARWALVLALLFCAVFWVRPTVALGAGAPVLLTALRAPHRVKRVVAMGAVALVLGALFIVAHASLTGSVSRTTYQAYVDYALGNGARFCPFPASYLEGNDAANLKLAGVGAWLAQAGVGVLRLNLDALGWASSFALAFFARGRRAGLWWAALVGNLATNALASDAGIDSFGPVHFFESALPLAVLAVMGARTVDAWARRVQLPGAGAAALLGFAVVGLIGVAAPRVVEAERLASDVARPREVVATQAPDQSVVFWARPVAPLCRSAPSKHFVFFRPNSAPGWSEAVLSVNHVSLARDRQFLASQYPGRKGFIAAATKDCAMQLLPLESDAAAAVPDSVKEVASDGLGAATQ